MSKKRPKRGTDSRSSNADRIGYGSPPAENRFPKGHSGNPHGRPKGRRNVANLTKDVLNRPVRVRTGDVTSEMRAVEAIFRVLVNKAAKGDTKAASLVDKLREMAGLGSTATDEEREKRGMRLPRAPSEDEFDLLNAQARERDRQRYLALAESAGHSLDPTSKTLPDIIPTAIKDGDQFAAQGDIDRALLAYRSQLAACKTALNVDSKDKAAQYEYRRAVARIGLVADTLLWAGAFQYALEVANEAIAEAAGGFWIQPKDPFGWPICTNTIWITLTRAYALMLLGQIEQAKAIFGSFATETRWSYTSWEGAILRDFVQFRRLGYSDPLMGEIERHFADLGHVRDTLIDTPGPVDRKFGHAADIRSCDCLAQKGNADDALTGYRRILADCKNELARNQSNRSMQAEIYLVAGRIGHLAKQFLLAGQFQEALGCADEALTYDPHSTLFNLNRAHALMLLERTDEARAIYFSYHGTKVSVSVLGEHVIRDDFTIMTKADWSHPLMNEIQRRFTNVKWSDRLDASGEVVVKPTRGQKAIVPGASDRPLKVPKAENQRTSARPIAPVDRANVLEAKLSKSLNGRDDLQSGDILLSEGKFDDALAVYKRRLEWCDLVRAKGVPNLQANEDRHIAVIKISEIALGFLLAGEGEKALATIDFAISAVPLSPIANLRRAHVLLLLKNEDEARGLYLQYRGKKLTPDQTSEDLILGDFQLLRQAGHTSPFMDEIEEILRGASSNSPRRILVR